MQNKSKKFKDLQTEWYAKIQNLGFEDIEQDEQHLKVWQSHFFKSNYSPATFQAKESYYQSAGRFLNDHTFERPMEHLVWSLHATGISNRQIAVQLKKQGHKTNRNMIDRIVKRLSKTMIASWGQNQDE